MTNKLPSPDDIKNTHEKVEVLYDLKHTGIRVAGPTIVLMDILEGVEEHDEVHMRAAQLLRDLITGHVFEDGNKRTAWVETRTYLRRHDLEPAETSPDDVDPVVKAIRAFDVEEIAEWLEMGEIDESKLHP